MKADDSFHQAGFSLASLVLAAAVLLLGGCKTSAFAPRTGEYFQATRMGPGVGCYAYATLMLCLSW